VCEQLARGLCLKLLHTRHNFIVLLPVDVDKPLIAKYNMQPFCYVDRIQR